jgi:hypothetical protein
MLPNPGTYYVRVMGETATDVEDVFDVTLECTTTDCPGLGNIGDACDDGDPDTFDDVVTANCTCEGTPVDCPGLGNIGDACDDGDPDTILDVVQPDCSCAGQGPAVNDTPCGALVLGCDQVITNQTLQTATASGPSNCGIAQDTDLWYVIQNDGQSLLNFVQIDQTGFMDAFLEVYEQGADCNDLIPIIECSDFNELALDEIELPQVAGTYYVRLMGETATDVEDVFDVTLECTTVDCPGLGNIGDACDDGDPLTGGDVITANCECVGTPVIPGQVCELPIVVSPANLPFNATDNTANYFDDYSSGDVPPLAPDAIVTGTGSSSYLNGDEVVYSFTSPQSGNIDITLSNTDTWVGLWVFTGCPFAETVAVHTGSDDGGREIANLPIEAGVTYYVVISTFPSPQSTPYDLVIDVATLDCPGLGNIGDPCDDGDPDTVNDTVQPDCTCQGQVPPANDNCEDVTFAFLLNCGETLTGNTSLAQTTDGLNDECNGFTSSTAEDVWYAFNVPAQNTDNYIITLQPGADELLDGVLFIYSGDCGNLVEIACSDTGLTSNSGEAIELIAPAAGVYYVRAYNWLSGGADYSINLTCVTNCVEPFPQVDQASLTSSVNPNNNTVSLGWDPVPFQIGCQIQVRLLGAQQNLGGRIILGPTVGATQIAGVFLDDCTDYEWRVRCGCSQDPLVAGDWTDWEEFSTEGCPQISTSPNPTEGQSFVTFEVPSETYTTLEVIDLNGRVISGVFGGQAQPNNEYRFEFDGSDLPNGVYIYRLTTEDQVVNEKFIIAR